MDLIVICISFLTITTLLTVVCLSKLAQSSMESYTLFIRYFALSQILFYFAFCSYVIRLISGYVGLSVVLANVFLLSALYLLILALMIRFHKTIQTKAYYFVALHIILVCAGQMFITSFNEGTVVNKLFAMLNFSVPLIICIKLLKQRLSVGNLGDKFAYFSLCFCLVFSLMLIPIITLLFRESEHHTLLYFSFAAILLQSCTLFSLIVSLYYEIVGKLELESSTDQLTGAKNRHYFFKIAKKLTSLSTRYHSNSTLIMIDLDDFKQINDQFGHSIGDQVLQRFCQTIQQLMRTEDTIIRYGGEEFLVLLPGIDNNQALQAAKRMRDEIRAIRINACNVTIAVTASFGISEIVPELSIDENIRLADSAMYQAKQQGKDRIVQQPIKASSSTNTG